MGSGGGGGDQRGPIGDPPPEIKRFYSCKFHQSYKKHNLCTPINPLFITGFSDGESSFGIIIFRDNNLKTNWKVQLFFQIILHEKDKILLVQIKNYFAVGYIIKKKGNALEFRVSSIKELQILISHFDKYPLITQKLADYLLFKHAFNLIYCKKHLTKDGLDKLIAIKSSMNRGLSVVLKQAFSHVEPVSRPLIKENKILNVNWLSGFTSAEGCFYVNIYKSSSYRQGLRVKLKFAITQHCRDEQLMKSLIVFFACGNIYKDRETFSFEVTKLCDIENKIIPFFKNNPILGIKSKDFYDFGKIAYMMKEKKHLTKQGLEQIKKIKAGMNTRRKWS